MTLYLQFWGWRRRLVIMALSSRLEGLVCLSRHAAIIKSSHSLFLQWLWPSPLPSLGLVAHEPLKSFSCSCSCPSQYLWICSIGACELPFCSRRTNPWWHYLWGLGISFQWGLKLVLSSVCPFLPRSSWISASRCLLCCLLASRSRDNESKFVQMLLKRRNSCWIEISVNTGQVLI